MPSILKDWDLQQVAPLAPDSKSIKAAEKLARPLKWETLGTNQAAAWGTLYGSGKKPYFVRLNLKTLADGDFKFKCTCPSRKQPCKHALALLMVAVSEGEKFVEGDAPEWVTEWLDAADARAAKNAVAKKPGPKNEAASAKTFAARKAKILAGLDELERWLINLIKGGLSDPAVQTYAFWEARAARLVDAQAPGIAAVLRGLAGLHVREKNWIDLMMAELGRLYLLIGAFRNFDKLNRLQQADLRTAVGWAIKKDEFESAPPINDHWLTLAVYERHLTNQLRERRVWLSGQRSEQRAMILEFAHGETPFGAAYRVGKGYSGDLLFYPSATTLRALPLHLVDKGNQTRFDDIQTGIVSELERYASLLAANPWQSEHLIQINARCHKDSRGWWVVDQADRRLPLSNELKNRWQLFAFSGGQPVTISGLWGGKTFLPLAGKGDNRWVNLQTAGGYS
ncbi:MAG: SWIM zinc finger family protein [Chloroflexota bacterium]